MENKIEAPEEVLTPSYHGEQCRYNGDNTDYEVACDECDYYLICFPDWDKIVEKPISVLQKSKLPLTSP